MADIGPALQVSLKFLPVQAMLPQIAIIDAIMNMVAWTTVVRERGKSLGGLSFLSTFVHYF
jgi:hypothetical protein